MGLQVQGLTKKIGASVPIDHLNMEMNQPGILGLVGASGSGKTTAMRLILGLIPKSEGTAVWNGCEISEKTEDIGYLPEDRGGYQKIRVLEQLIYFGMLHGMRRKEAKSSAEQWLSICGLSEYAYYPMEHVKKTDQQLIEFITVLVHHPKLLFLDEPFSGLDPAGRELVQNLLKNLVREGCFIVLGTHQLAVAEEYCENIVMLSQGKCVLQGNLRKIKEGYGHTNLVIACDVDVTDTAKEFGMELIERRYNETEYKIQGDEMANALLAHMLSQGFYPSKFEIREPSLGEIFREKTGGKKI